MDWRVWGISTVLFGTILGCWYYEMQLHQMEDYTKFLFLVLTMTLVVLLIRPDTNSTRESDDPEAYED